MWHRAIFISFFLGSCQFAPSGTPSNGGASSPDAAFLDGRVGGGRSSPDAQPMTKPIRLRSPPP